MAVYIYPNLNFAQAVSMETDGTNIYVPSWKDTSIFTLSGTNFTLSSSTLPSGMSFGISSGAIDSSNNLWFCGYDGYISEFSTPSLSLMSTVPLTLNNFYMGMANSGGYIYAMNTNGNLETVVSGNIQNTSISLGFLSKHLVSEGSDLYTITTTPSGSSLATMTMTSQLSGTSSLSATPFHYTTSVNVASSNVCVGGYNQFTWSFVISGLAPVISTTGAINDIIVTNTSQNLIEIYNIVDKVPTLASQVSGDTAPSFISFEQTQTQLFVSNTPSGIVQLLLYANQALSPSTTFSITTPSYISFTSVNDYAFVSQGTGFSVLLNSSPSNPSSTSWSIVQSNIALANANCVLPTSNASAIATTTSGVAFYSLSGSTWSQTSTLPLPYTPTLLVNDSAFNTYAIGVSGTTGYVTLITNKAVVYQDSWTGTPVSLGWYNSVLSILDTYNNDIRLYTTLNGSMQYYSKDTITSSLSAFFYQNNILASTSTSTLFYENFYTESDFIEIIKNNGYSIYNGSTWSTTTLISTYGWPTSITYDTSNNFWMATSNNYLLEISNSGSLLSETPITPYSSTVKAPPLGISKMIWVGSHLYGVSSIGAGIIQLQ